MPKLAIIAPCDRLIFDKVGIASLINIFQRLEARVGDAPFPADAMSPMSWSVYTQWFHDEASVGAAYVQRTEIIKPSGEVFSTTDIAFTVAEGNTYTRHFTQINGFPIGFEGFFKIRVSIDGIPEASGEYVLELRYIRSAKEGETIPTTTEA